VIKTHEFNTEWWGEKVGIVTDVKFFDLGRTEQESLLSGYVWAEFHAQLGPELPMGKMHSAGFFYVSTQIPFRVPLNRLASGSSLESLTVVSADEKPFRVELDEMAPFMLERFSFLPGIEAKKLNERYVLMANNLIHESPSLCFKVFDGSSPQGWFLSRKEGGTLNLALAMLHRDAHFSGQQIYHKALLEYASRGERAGGASFDIRNTAVHNIYSSLGARFLQPRGIWLWLSSVLSEA